MTHCHARFFAFHETARHIVCPALQVIRMHLLLRSLLLLRRRSRRIVRRWLRLLQLLRIERLTLHLKHVLAAHAQTLPAPAAHLTCCYFQPLNLFS